MKFHNGCWLYKEGYGCFSPQEIYEIHREEEELRLCMPTAKIRTKGDTIGGINLTLRVTCPAKEVIRVQGGITGEGSKRTLSFS